MAQARALGSGRAELDAASELADRAKRLLEAASRQARKGMRAAGPEGDQIRAAVLAMAAQADADLYEARLVLDRLLRSSQLDDVYAPRPIIELDPPSGG